MPSTSSPPLDRLRTFPQGWLRYFPALDSLLKYSGAAARADLLAGLTVAAVAVPQAMAYALVAGVPPQYGLYTAIVMTAIGAFFDSSRQLINGPTNAISIAVLSVTAAIADPGDKINTIIVMSLLIGCIQTAIALLRLGDITKYISHSVIVGFTVGASLLLVIDQMKNLLGKKAMGGVHDHFLMRFWRSMTEGGDVHLYTLWVGLASIALVLGLRWAKQRLHFPLLPELLITVISVSAITALLGLEGVGVVGTIPASLPSFHFPHTEWVFIKEIAPSALAIATLGLLEAIAMAKSIASAKRQQLDLNQQCLSEGLANMGGGFFQCIPGSGSLTRSAINTQAGAITQWSGVFSAVAVAAIVLLFAPLAQYIPKACLAGILIMTAVRMIDPASLIYHVRASHFDAGIVIATAFSAVFISIEFCILIGVFLSFMLAVPRAGRMLLTEFSISSNRVLAERRPEDPECSSILMFGLEGEMFFGSASTLEKHLHTIDERLKGGAKVLVLRMKRIRNPDAVCMHMLSDQVEHWEAAGVHVMLCGVRDDLYQALERTRFNMQESEVFREQKLRFSSTLAAVQRAYELLGEENNCPHCAGLKGKSQEAYYYMV
ncbi:MAG: SulP family inorganic anion transporter [Flavobacteriales bacterium]|nr:SulP family inorganic anion transporter [Flavobacteriales bacterium]MBP9079767.1 SulP family inorganic anion transporter [Flavobacteriales bacterium]